MDLTVGYVSGFIALAIFVIRFLLPNIISLILVHVLRDEQSAITWTVASRDLQNSSWPTILRSDAVASKSVKPTVKVLSLLRDLMLVLITVAAVITPLGLFSFIEISKDVKLVDFAYAKDKSKFALGTDSRPSNLSFSRLCGQQSIACPGTSLLQLKSYPGIAVFDSRVPNYLFSLFESGLATQKSSVSSIFDIQWRNYVLTNSLFIDRGKPYAQGTYRQLETHIPARGIELVEGLIVDYNSAGIGFRNHTLPGDSTVDAEWQEDILFIEPETSCVDTNLTRSFVGLGKNSADPGLGATVEASQNEYLIDRGGFANFKPAAPYPYYGNTQKDPKIAHRAFNGGWLNNFETMVYMNITIPSTHPWDFVKAKLNDKYILSENTSSIDLNTIETARYNRYILDRRNRIGEFYKNPYDLTRVNYTYPTITCEGAGGLDEANITHIGTRCGLVYGVAQKYQSQVDDGPHGSGQTILSYQQPIYSCASTTRAIIKTVHFRYKASAAPSLDSLEVVSLRDKKYDTDSELPYWGVENPHLNLGEVFPLWGLVDKDLARKAGPDISVVQSERLYLPGLAYDDRYLRTADDYEVPDSGGNLPGANFYLAILMRMYQLQAPYTGYNNFALARLWKKLSVDTNGTAEMMNLIWTDIAANAVMGSRGWLSAHRTFPDKDADLVLENQKSRSVPVHLYVSKVGYHWWYSIPAFLTLAAAGLLTATGMACMVFGRASPEHIRFYLNSFSVGRLMMLSQSSDIDTPTKEWVKQKGHERIDICNLGADKESVGEVSVEANEPS